MRGLGIEGIPIRRPCLGLGDSSWATLRMPSRALCISRRSVRRWRKASNCCVAFQDWPCPLKNAFTTASASKARELTWLPDRSQMPRAMIGAIK